MNETQHKRGRPVRHEEARAAALRLINHSVAGDVTFREPVRKSIPVHAYDDDVTLLDYIAEQAALSDGIALAGRKNS